MTTAHTDSDGFSHAISKHIHTLERQEGEYEEKRPSQLFRKLDNLSANGQLGLLSFYD